MASRTVSIYPVLFIVLTQFEASLIAMFVVGGIILIAFALWEVR